MSQEPPDAAKLTDAEPELKAEGELTDQELTNVAGGWGPALSTYSTTESLASSVLKKRDDTGNAVISKI